MTLILASASTIRQSMLTAAGVDFAIVPALIDEDSEKMRHHDPARLAETLAVKKALAVSGAHEGWVIGSDSVASLDGDRFDKPSSREQAADQLRSFAGNSIALTSAAALARDGAADWSHVETARLKVRPLTEAFIQSYLDAEWPAVGQCAGAFRLEGRGVQLFETIEGSYFTILGMPLLPLLAALRHRRVIES